MNSYERHLSKLLSKVLRHSPKIFNLKLDDKGWCNVEVLIKAFQSNKKDIDFDKLKKIVNEDDKKRYSFNDDYTLIRANQGHSIPVDLELEEEIPPDYLYHGTSKKSISSIKNKGILPMKRIYVHLSLNEYVAINVGNRKGTPVVLRIKAKVMYNAGYKFYISKNGVWLSKKIPKEYIEFSQL